MFFGSKLDKDFFSEFPDLTHSFHLQKPVTHDECTHFIESLMSLKQLLQEKSAGNEDPVLRFLVDTSGIAWFARETHPNIPAPKHFQMTGSPQNKAHCCTAGNLVFTNSRCKILKKINHRSGDFQPSFHSLRLFIVILILNESLLPFTLARTLIVQELNPSGETACKHRWSVAKIRAWVMTFDDVQLIKQLTQQHVARKRVYYNAVHENEFQ